MRSRSVPLCQRLVIRLVCFLVLSSLASAQRSYVRPLVNEPVEDGRRVRLKGNTHPLARPQFDVATAPPNLLMERMLLVLKRSPEQQTALLNARRSAGQVVLNYHNGSAGAVRKSLALPTPQFGQLPRGFSRTVSGSADQRGRAVSSFPELPLGAERPPLRSKYRVKNHTGPMRRSGDRPP